MPITGGLGALAARRSYYGDAVQTTADLTAIPVADRADKQYRLVEDEGGSWRFDLESALASSPPTVLVPDDSPATGRWILDPSVPSAHTHVIADVTDLVAATESVAGIVKRKIYSAKSADYTIPDTSVWGEHVSVDATAAAVDITLPVAANVPAGTECAIKDAKDKATTNAIRFVAQGADTIDLVAAQTLIGDGDSYTCISDGTSNWEVI